MRHHTRDAPVQLSLSSQVVIVMYYLVLPNANVQMYYQKNENLQTLNTHELGKIEGTPRGTPWGTPLGYPSLSRNPNKNDFILYVNRNASEL